MDLENGDQLSPHEIEALLQSKQDFLDGKTTAKDWEDVEAELDMNFDQTSEQQG